MVVLVSIKPLALITEPLLSADDELSILLPPVSSPHDYSLKASDMSRLSEADLVVWMGPRLERFLSKPLARIDSKKQVLANPESVKNIENGINEHDLGDPHYWLDPQAVEGMTVIIGEKLMELDPENQFQIRQRVDNQVMRLQELHQSLQRQFFPIKERSFVVYHRAYDHLVTTYGLNQIGAITLTPEQPAGARHLVELQAQLKAAPARCLFVEASHDSAAARTIARQLHLEVALLDPLGVAESIRTYPDLMLQLANDMVSCLSPQ